MNARDMILLYCLIEEFCTFLHQPLQYDDHPDPSSDKFHQVYKRISRLYYRRIHRRLPKRVYHQILDGGWPDSFVECCAAIADDRIDIGSNDEVRFPLAEAIFLHKTLCECRTFANRLSRESQKTTLWYLGVAGAANRACDEVLPAWIRSASKFFVE